MIVHGIWKNARDGIATTEIKAKGLDMVRAKNPGWERNWSVYDAAIKKRTG